MGKAIPTQHPAVVLRSHFNLVRALLAATTLAVVGLTIAVVIVANDNDEVSSSATAQPAGSIGYGDFNPGTGRPNAAPLPQQHPLQSRVGGTRYDGGPEEGTRGITGAQSGAAVVPQRKLDGVTDQPRYDGGPEEGTRGLSANPPAPDTRYDGGPEEGSRGPGARTN
jgi:hypothetical protein